MDSQVLIDWIGIERISKIAVDSFKSTFYCGNAWFLIFKFCFRSGNLPKWVLSNKLLTLEGDGDVLLKDCVQNCAANVTQLHKREENGDKGYYVENGHENRLFFWPAHEALGRDSTGGYIASGRDGHFEGTEKFHFIRKGFIETLKRKVS